MSKHILVCLPISAEQKARIEAVQGFEYRFTTPDTATAADALWANAVLGNLPVQLIRQNDHLKWFQSNAAGPNNYLEPGVLPEGCIVTNATGAYGLAISECMLALWLSLLKELPIYRDNQREHRWAPTGRSVGSIAGSRVLCVGMGDIGSNFARRAHALGAEVVGVRRTVHPDTPCPDYCTRVVAQSALDAELPQADLVALSLPGTPETEHLFNAERLALCKRGAILLNVGRGTTVDGEALAAAASACPRRWTTSWISLRTTSSATPPVSRWITRWTAAPSTPAAHGCRAPCKKDTKNCRTTVRQFFVSMGYSITAPAQGRRPWR